MLSSFQRCVSVLCILVRAKLSIQPASSCKFINIDSIHMGHTRFMRNTLKLIRIIYLTIYKFSVDNPYAHTYAQRHTTIVQGTMLSVSLPRPFSLALIISLPISLSLFPRRYADFFFWLIVGRSNIAHDCSQSRIHVKPLTLHVNMYN